MELPAGYTEWQPPVALRDVVSCLWAQVTPPGAARDNTVLPDGCSDLIWERGRDPFVAGPDTRPVPAPMRESTVMLGVRFRPGMGGPALGLPLSELRDQRVPLAELRRADAGRIPGSLDADRALARLVDLAGRLVADARPDLVVLGVAALLASQDVPAADAAARVGVSARQLRRRFHDAVGYGPKTLHRVIRFRRFVDRVDSAGPLDLATVAAESGYADQAHLSRECVSLAGLPPAALARQRRP